MKTYCDYCKKSTNGERKCKACNKIKKTKPLFEVIPPKQRKAIEGYVGK